MDLADIIAIDQPDVFWDTVAEAIGQILSGLGRGRRILHMASPVQPFLPTDISHMHESCEVALGSVGEGMFVLREGSVPVRPGEVTMIPRGIPHRELILNTRQPYANIIMNIQPDRFFGHTRVTRNYKGGIQFRTSFTDPRAARSFQYVQHAFAAVGQGADERHHLVRGLIMACLALLKEAIDSRESVEPGDHLVHQARICVETHLSDPLLCVAYIARGLGYSADYLSHRFHTVTGTRLTAYVTEQRMDLATRLLAEDTLNISEVARACGYQDPAYFSRVFQKCFRQSPRAWREALPK